jgi:carbon storage regulator
MDRFKSNERFKRINELRRIRMLVLKRRRGESVNIGDNILVSVVSVSGRDVRIGFTAPPDVAIHRGEVYDRIQADKARPQTADELRAAAGL